MRPVKDPKARGILPVLKERLFGARDPVEDHLRALARQGAGMARLAHVCAVIMLLLFSLGSLVGIAGESVTTFLAAWQHGTLDLIDGIVIGASTTLVLCMDVGSLYAALMLRILVARGGSWRERLPHVTAILLADVFEAGTMVYMTWRYDPPLIVVVWLLIIGRDIAAPFYAVYLGLAQPLPVRARDSLHVVEMALGASVARDAVHLANDPNVPIALKLTLLTAVSARTSDANRQDVAQLQSILALLDADAIEATAIGVETVHGPDLDAPAEFRTSTERTRRRRQTQESPHLAPSDGVDGAVSADKVVDGDIVPGLYTIGRSNVRTVFPLEGTTAPPFRRDAPPRADTGISQELRADLRTRREEIVRQILKIQPRISVREMRRLIKQGTGRYISESTVQGLLEKLRAETQEREEQD